MRKKGKDSMNITDKDLEEAKKDSLEEIATQEIANKGTMGSSFKNWKQLKRFNQHKATFIEGIIDVMIRNIRKRLKASK